MRTVRKWLADRRAARVQRHWESVIASLPPQPYDVELERRKLRNEVIYARGWRPSVFIELDEVGQRRQQIIDNGTMPPWLKELHHA